MNSKTACYRRPLRIPKGVESLFQRSSAAAAKVIVQANLERVDGEAVVVNVSSLEGETGRPAR